MNIKIKEKIIAVLLIILYIISQILLPITLSYNNEIQKIYKYIPKERKISNKWSIIIPVIDLEAPIENGVESEILNKYVGHFEESGYILGNVSLAAHNRGFPVNYFKDLKYLEIGDEIIYEYKDLKLKYRINNIEIIKDTDVEVVEDTKENKITLITCVENQPENRRCIQGKLIL